MARMSREFTLVLLGASLLTAGYFLWPEDNPEKRADDLAAGGGGGGDNGSSSTNNRYRSRGIIIIPIITRTGGATSTVSRPAISRGGFGRVGGTTVGG